MDHRNAVLVRWRKVTPRVHYFGFLLPKPHSLPSMNEPRWRSPVIYRLDPELFQDSTGDGVGDAQGILRRADYLSDLGVDAVLVEVPRAYSLSKGPADFSSQMAARGLELLTSMPSGNVHCLDVELTVRALSRWVGRLETDPAPPDTALTLGGPDLPRVASRLGERGAALAAVLQLTLPGTPVIWFGDEIGMEDAPDFMGDAPPSPMLWDASPGAGFTTGVPLSSVATDAAFRNVAIQSDAPDSLLNLYRRLLKLRRRVPALRRGGFHTTQTADDCFCFLREALDGPGSYKRMLVALNLGGDPAHIILPAPGRVMLWSHAPTEDTNLVEVLRLDPLEAAVAVLFA